MLNLLGSNRTLQRSEVVTPAQTFKEAQTGFMMGKLDCDIKCNCDLHYYSTDWSRTQLIL